MTRLVLIHGAASSAGVWSRLTPLLVDCEVFAVTRPRTGDLDEELAWLAPRVEGSWVVGMSGGATLGLALAGSGITLAGAVLHEPAVGSLAPGLLAPMAAAFERGGTEAFARTLYGASWTPETAGGPGPWLEDAVTRRELAMFRGFEPVPATAAAGQVLVTYGEQSPPVRREAAEALTAAHGHQIQAIPGAAHFAAHDAPEEFAGTVLKALRA